jgi:hypothetical protein
MMHRVRLLAAAAAMSSFVLVTACDDDDDPSGPPDVERTNFTATLNGANERPNPVTTTGQGTGTFTLFDDDSLTFTLQVASIDSVIMAHIHAGDDDEAGDILFGFPATDPPQDFTTLATLHTGTITPTSTGFQNSFTWDSLLTCTRDRIRPGRFAVRS